jgi:xanthine dehydrogenase accessory factor
MRSLTGLVILNKGAGEAASAIAHRLHVSHFKVCMTELRNPLAVCRATTYSEAIFDTEKTIEGVTAELVRADLESVNKIWAKNRIPIVVDPGLILKDIIKPDVLIDATLAKKSTNLKIMDAPLVIGLGQGFFAVKNVHMI